MLQPGRLDRGEDWHRGLWWGLWIWHWGFYQQHWEDMASMNVPFPEAWLQSFRSKRHESWKRMEKALVNPALSLIMMIWALFSPYLLFSFFVVLFFFALLFAVVLLFVLLLSFFLLAELRLPLLFLSWLPACACRYSLRLLLLLLLLPSKLTLAELLPFSPCIFFFQWNHSSSWVSFSILFYDASRRVMLRCCISHLPETCRPHEQYGKLRSESKRRESRFNLQIVWHFDHWKAGWHFL